MYILRKGHKKLVYKKSLTMGDLDMSKSSNVSISQCPKVQNSVPKDGQFGKKNTAPKSPNSDKKSDHNRPKTDFSHGHCRRLAVSFRLSLTQEE